MQRKTAINAVFLIEGKSIIPKFSGCPHPATIKAVNQTADKSNILNKITIALIIAKPGHLRNSLQSLLRTMPQIEMLAETSDPSILLKMDLEIHPELILIDGGLLTEANWSQVKTIKANWPETKVLVLTDNDQQGQAAREAGADLYLLKGYPATDLARLIENSLIPGSDDGLPAFRSE